MRLLATAEVTLLTNLLLFTNIYLKKKMFGNFVKK